MNSTILNWYEVYENYYNDILYESKLMKQKRNENKSTKQSKHLQTQILMLL